MVRRDRLNPRVDLAFKKLFGVEENKDLLISLINSIVSDQDQVADLILLNPYNPQNCLNDKLSILDVKAQGIDGKLFNIEIQISDEADYDKRALYYWGKLYTQQLKQGDSYGSLSKAIGIHILNFLSIPESDKYHNVFQIAEKDSGLLYFNDLELHTIELSKFAKGLNNDLAQLVDKIKTALDMWVGFLTKYDLLDADNLPKSIDDHSLKKAINVLEVMNFSDQENDAYEAHLKWLRIEASSLEKRFQDGIKIGEVKGIEKGREEGIEIGKEEGLKLGEVKALEQTAINMLKAHLDLPLISSITGLSLEDLIKIKSQL